MKQFLLLASLVFTFTSVSAQEVLTINPIEVEQTFVEDLSNILLDLEVHADVTNNSGDTLYLRWVREVMEAPEDWQTQVCDNNLCYAPIVDSNYDPSIGVEMAVMMVPDTTFELIFHVRPRGNAGYGEYEIPFYYYPDQDTTVLGTATFKVTVESVTDVSEETKAKLRVFPNPATDYIELTNNDVVDQMVVYNLLGREVKNFNVINGRQYEVADLPNGMYLVSLINEEEGILKTFRLNKRSIRP